MLKNSRRNATIQDYRHTGISPKAAPRWRDVPGYPGYRASNGGQIQRRLRNGTYRLLRPSKPCPYPQISVLVDGKRKTRRVHALVCRAFHGRPPSRKHIACHKNGNRADSRASNLYWGTYRSNLADAVRHGTAKAKLAPETAAEIRRNYKPICGVVTALAKQYGVTRRSMTELLAGRSWPDASNSKAPGYPWKPQPGGPRTA